MKLNETVCFQSLGKVPNCPKAIVVKGDRIDGDFSESNEIVNEHCMIQGEYRATYAEVQHVAVSLQRCFETLGTCYSTCFTHDCGTSS